MSRLKAVDRVHKVTRAYSGLSTGPMTSGLKRAYKTPRDKLAAKIKRARARNNSHIGYGPRGVRSVNFNGKKPKFGVE